MNYSCIGTSGANGRVTVELLDFVQLGTGKQRNLIYFSVDPKNLCSEESGSEIEEITQTDGFNTFD